jgi:hypothetical protein
VRDEQVRQFAFGAQAAQQLEDPGLRGDVERAGRLVENEQPGETASARAIAARCRCPPDTGNSPRN